MRQCGSSLRPGPPEISHYRSIDSNYSTLVVDVDVDVVVDLEVPRW